MRAWLQSLARLGSEVLGINARNLDWVYTHNPRRGFRAADDKLLAKQLLDQAGVPTPETLAIVRGFRDIAPLREQLSQLAGFVVKPASASGGKGILVVSRNGSGELSVPSRRGTRSVSEEDVLEHVSQLLSGLVTPARLNETVFLEELLEADEVLGAVGGDGAGLPDVRVIVVRGAPLMAMLRIPTRRSRGKANLHQGALGLGVDLDRGDTNFAVQGNRRVENHPDSGAALSGIAVPHWEQIIAMSRRAAGCVELGYLGVDIIIDRRRGPLVIELNARPGLSIQLANRAGLKPRLAQEPSRA